MKTRILASIITGILATSAAQAGTAFSNHDLDTIYSGLNPSFTRDLDISGYYTAPAQLQTAEHKSTCGWRVVKNDINAPQATHIVAGNNEYFAPANVQLVC